MSVQDLESKSYDFVIIGGGTAGLVLASRLTENPQTNVLVLEAGASKLDDPKINIPALFTQLYEDPEYDWCFKSTPQQALNNRIIAQPRGKVLGGTSAINFLMASHGTASEFQHWEELGNPGWNWESMLQYYRKSESFNPPTEDLYGSDGPVQLTMPIGTGASDASWQPTLQALGIPSDTDPRVPGSLGGWPLLKYTDSTGKRSYAASAYYASIAGRPNLTVLTSAYVTKMLLDAPEKSGGSAKVAGVSFILDKVEHVVRATKGTILAGGSYMSPKLLELSGIGSSSLLQKLGIDVVVDNAAVGENLQDHPMVPLIIEAQDGVMGAESFRQPEVLQWALNEWMSGRGGPLSSGINGTSFLSTQSIARHIGQAPDFMQSIGTNRDDEHSPFLRKLLSSDSEADIQISFAPAGFDPYKGGEALSRLFTHPDPGNYLGSVAVLTHPFSRGSVHVTSSDPQIAPSIDPNYLDHPVDFELLVQDYVRDREDGSGKKIQDSFKIPTRIDRGIAEKLVREATIPSWHPVGTCAMLPREKGGVVNPQLKVYGVDKLRVVDASIMPVLVRGNIATAVYAIAEKAADIIKEEYNL
ncbi:GMC oxidoreductase domain-containing protein [Trichoderma breve]|uniref:GMC oxidoreductase domain-containing protein n=1 Tax=Trichoderma breve TaxID=2034170 RepID=A0A9W9JS94_9HYPO|nr:GMC oxidoreductase domain-containing protein [Trichoderma breve]KAJ4865664.1 GMC oxidoreductase domain-containing protein [Trichoderma breve]